MDSLPTRKDYMDGRVSHGEYYRSIYQRAGIWLDDNHEFIGEVRDALVSGDEHLNTIALDRWDKLSVMAKWPIDRAMKEHGGAWSLAGGVCTMKQAAKDAAYRAMNAEEREICGVKGES